MKNIKRFFQNISFSLQGLGSNKMTSFLTLLGIVIGIGSVIGLMSLGRGTQESIVNELENLGTDIVTITAGANKFGQSAMSEDPFDRDVDVSQSMQDRFGAVDDTVKLTIDDYNFLHDESFKNVKDVSFTIVSSQDIYIDDEENVESYSVVGTNMDFFTIYEFEFDSGKSFVQADIDDSNHVAVIGSQILEEYGVAVGDIVSIGDVEFEVVGVLVNQEDSLLGSSPNVEVYIPFSVVEEIGGDSNLLTKIIVRVEDDGVLDQTIIDIEDDLMEFRGVDEIDFSILSIQTLIDMVKTITDTFTLLLTGIAAISLLVSGIGISNVMLITVTQRTREIGIRKAVGARRSDILVQFLSEAVFLTLIGGVFGIGFGVLIGVVAKRFLDIDAIITLDSVALAVGISVGIGILFGLLPANKASKLSPIESLRYE